MILAETELLPDYLELELTESLLKHDVESSAALLDSLKTMGIKLAIENFGTGFSSLSYLKRFLITSLRIDQSFVRDIAADINDAMLVRYDAVTTAFRVSKTNGFRADQRGIATSAGQSQAIC